uniref:G_PROTEIN_RECEP_F1_2 domain-containing protein n=1 Tax=Globodera pallida TaxID=36090 RepID=A0A183BSA9_GLOPA
MPLQNYSMANLAFDRFGYGIFSLELVLSTFFRWLISLPGLVFNAALLYTIKRDKNLRGTCAILLAIGAVCDFCFLLAFSVAFSVALSGRNVISNFGCYFVQFLPVFGLYSYTLLEKNLLVYITPMLTITFGYSTFVLMAASHWTLFIYPDCFGMSSTLLRNGLVINGVSFSCYVLVGLVLLRCWRKNPSSVAKHRIFKSLAAIMALVVGSYFAICAVRLLTVSVTDPFFLLHISPSISALFTCTAASSNAPLLFAFRAMNPSQSLNKKDGKSHRKSPRLIEMAAAKEDKKKTQQKLGPANKHRGNGGESSSSNTTNRGASSAMDRPQNDLRPPIEWADRSERHDSLLSLAEACADNRIVPNHQKSKLHRNQLDLKLHLTVILRNQLDLKLTVILRNLKLHLTVILRNQLDLKLHLTVIRRNPQVPITKTTLCKKFKNLTNFILIRADTLPSLWNWTTK